MAALMLAGLQPLAAKRDKGRCLVQDHYKGYKHQRMVARQASAARNPGYHAGNGMHGATARRMPFTPQHQPHPAGLGYGSPNRSPYPYPHPRPYPADGWQTG